MPGTYGPVSLTSIVCKTLESIMKNSCLTTLLTMEEKVANVMDSGDTVDLGFLDFSKAFDLVSHNVFSRNLKFMVLMTTSCIG